MKISILIFLQLWSIALMAQREWRLSTPEGTLKGTLLLPRQKRNIPVVLLLAGSGATDRDGNQSGGKNNALKYLAQALQKQNIATLRIDKRGVAGSKKAAIKEEDLRFEQLVDDVKAWVSLLARKKRFNKIIVAGHSQGATVGLLAAIDNPNVDAFVSLAGPGRALNLLLREQIAKQPQMIQELVYPILTKLEQGDTVNTVSPMLHSLFRPSIQKYMISWIKYDPSKEIKKLKIATLIVQGTNDIQVQEKDATLLAEAYPKAQKVIIKNMNHVLKEFASMDMFKQMKSYSDPSLALHPALSKAIVTFVKNLK